MTRLMLVIGLICSVIIVGCGDAQDGGEETSGVDPERISLEEFRDLLDSKADIVIVDTRSLTSYEAGHIPGAISISYPDEIRARNQELPRDKMIVFYCS